MTVPFRPPTGPEGEQVLPTCFRHPDRRTGLRCSRCDRPACPDCLREAAVGYQCVECVAQGARTVRSGQGRTIAGAVVVDKLVMVPALIGINVLIYVITMVQSRSVVDVTGAGLWQQWALQPDAVAAGDWWRLITSGFLHNTPLHILCNMVALWIIGKDMERILGRARFLAVYLVSLFGGSVSVLLFADPGVPVAGASGAIFGLMGGVLIAVLKLKLNPTSAIAIIVINLILSVAIPGISLLGHLGGLVVGALVTAAIIYAPQVKRDYWQVGALVVAVLVLVSLVFIRDPQLAQPACLSGYFALC